MATYRVKPSKPVAIFGAVVGAAILVFGIVQMVSQGVGNNWFLVLWVLVGLGVISFNLWAAFARNGSLQTIHTDGDEPPTRVGMEYRRD